MIAAREEGSVKLRKLTLQSDDQRSQIIHAGSYHANLQSDTLERGISHLGARGVVPMSLIAT